MRIISCHIENFGRLHNFDYDFSEGCNYIAGHNGWGKSTLAAFIRVMLYGFEGEKKRSGNVNERKRWQPWQGGVYGGTLVFINNGRTYKVSRIFGSKAADDRFELRDAVTNLKLSDYTEQLGEEIFGVNSESFMRTVYIGQNDVVTSTTDGINAKIGNIADDTSDIDCYEKAADRLNSLLNQNSPSRVTGSIYKLKTEIVGLQAEINSEENLAVEIAELENRIKEGEKSMELLAEYMDANVSGQRKVAEYKDIQAVLNVYGKISEDCQRRCEEAENKRKTLPAELPDKDELREYLELAAKAAELKGRASGCAVSEEDEKYLAKLREKYADGSVNEDKLLKIQRKWNEREKMMIEEAGEAATIKVKLAEIESRANKVRTPAKAYLGIIFILFAIVMAVVTVLFSPKQIYTYAGLGMSAAVAVCGILFAFFIARNHRASMDEYFDEKYEDMDKKERALQKKAESRKQIEKETEEFFDSLGIKFSDKSVQDDIHAIRSEMDSYERLLLRQMEYFEMLKDYEKVEDKLNSYFDRQGIEAKGDYQSVINDLLINLNSYEEAAKVAEAAQVEKARFEKEKDIESLSKINIPDNTPAVNALTEEYEQMGREALRISSEQKDNKLRLEALLEKKGLVDEKAARLADLQEKLARSEKNYGNLEKTVRYIALAKESMTSRYMGPLMKSFDKYYSVVTGRSATDYRLDANINLTVENLGVQHDVELLSTGYQDLIGLCMRLALVDAMYEGERPMLILDDPFVNFDSEHREGAAELLDELAKDYQLIYFTCS